MGELFKYLKSQRLMALVTVNRNKPWVCSVYYVIDKDLNLYFVSSPMSKHSKQLDKNNNVAVAIADSHITNAQNKVGVQIQGLVSQIKGWKKIDVFLKMWHKVNPGAEKINIKNMQAGVVSSRIYKIKPTYIKFLNKVLFGKDSYREYKL